MDKRPFAQTFIGAVLVGVLTGLILWLVTGRQTIRVELTNTAGITNANQPESYRPRSAGTFTTSTDGTVHQAASTALVQTTEWRESTVDDCTEAVINDPDRYTNIRGGPGTKYDVIARILEGEVFCVTSRKGNWWPIRTANGITGYIYYDRVRIISPKQK